MCEPYVGRGRGDNERGVPSLVLEPRIENGREKFTGDEDETEGVVLVPDINAKSRNAIVGGRLRLESCLSDFN